MNDPDGSLALLGTGAAARQLGVSRTTLARWVSEGRLKPTMRTMGGHLRWDLDDLRRQLADIEDPGSSHSRGE